MSGALDFFLLFCKEHFTKIVEETSRNAEQCSRTKPDPTWYETTCEEICAFLALNVLFGIKTLGPCRFEKWIFVRDASLHRQERWRQPEHSLEHCVVSDLVGNLQGKNYHIFCDTFFTSIPLAEDLLAKNLYLCGTTP